MGHLVNSFHDLLEKQMIALFKEIPNMFGMIHIFLGQPLIQNRYISISIIQVCPNGSLISA